ncbi:hypothetical protein J3Q64DRAFT_1834155 [Phycomyces blakesleeanus]|uniref:Uncharacterized protein n=2 Tax=Phycomyces blakesleeanus TaxID=4837 RepID=A0A167NA86_PHYB8|nr:hypothetical protein PHYBLDRAFT_143710 [Phycomyces blakesleeanus NRRL 1555(-)]OAD75469.1 hypothetical protein PHYBLDRAFT_143710 [Phycomyces blakesleeanus NRRL 1555(-)]|eukprot:XP_018293509.1 hypothetical protein PHYBLDRAFT_143710 [Phycomyces blakesleeanus NRRL 1555(-)]
MPKQLTRLPRSCSFTEKSEGNSDDRDLNSRPILARPIKEEYTSFIEGPTCMEEDEALLVLKKYFVDGMSMGEAGNRVEMPRSTAGRLIRRIRKRLDLLAKRERMHKYASLE